MAALTMLVPLWARWLMLAALIGTLLGVGFYKGDQHRGLVDDKEIAAMKHADDAALAAAQAALIAANKRASDASNGAVTDQASISAAYTKGIADEQAASKARIAQLLASGQRVRVDATCTNAARGQPVPGAAASADGPDGTATADVELSTGALERLSSATDSAFGKLTQKVIGLQALAQSQHDRCNQVSTTAK